MLKPRNFSTLKVISSCRGKDPPFVPGAYLFWGSITQLIGNACGGGEGGGGGRAAMAPGMWISVGAPSAGRDFRAASSSSGVLSTC